MGKKTHTHFQLNRAVITLALIAGLAGGNANRLSASLWTAMTDVVAGIAETVGITSAPTPVIQQPAQEEQSSLWDLFWGSAAPTPAAENSGGAVNESTTVPAYQPSPATLPDDFPVSPVDQWNTTTTPGGAVHTSPSNIQIPATTGFGPSIAWPTDILRDQQPALPGTYNNALPGLYGAPTSQGLPVPSVSSPTGIPTPSYMYTTGNVFIPGSNADPRLQTPVQLQQWQNAVTGSYGRSTGTVFTPTAAGSTVIFDPDGLMVRPGIGPVMNPNTSGVPGVQVLNPPLNTWEAILERLYQQQQQQSGQGSQQGAPSAVNNGQNTNQGQTSPGNSGAAQQNVQLFLYPCATGICSVPWVNEDIDDDYEINVHEGADDDIDDDYVIETSSSSVSVNFQDDDYEIVTSSSSSSSSASVGK